MNPEFFSILILVAAVIFFAAYAMILVRQIYDKERIERLLEDRNRLQEDRHQLFRVLNYRHCHRIAELEAQNDTLKQFIQSHVKPPTAGEDADWWKKE